MIFDDNLGIVNCIHLETIAAKGDTFHRDQQDPEINRLFTSSPPAAAIANAATYYGDNSFYRTDIETKSSMDEDDRKMKKSSSGGDRVQLSSKIYAEMVRAYARMDSKDKAAADKMLFEPVPVPELPPRTAGENESTASSSDGRKHSTPPAPAPSFSSLLTRSLIAPESSKGSKGKGGTTVTIYLPDRGEMEVSINYSSTVEQVIRLILKAHKQEGIRPALQYNQPEQYELRLHEGDGMPDEDFFLERQKPLSEYGKETEYCICEAFDDDFMEVATSGASGLRVSAAQGAGRPSNDSDSFSGRGVGSPGGDNSLTVYIPHVGPMYIPMSDEVVTLRDLLPIINKKHRLRLYTDQYEFIVSQEEKERLKLAVPTFDLDTVIAVSGFKEVELRKKVFADASKLVPGGKYTKDGKQSTKQAGQASNQPNTDAGREGGANEEKSIVVNNGGSTSNSSQAAESNHSNTMRTYTDKYTDATAAVYEEWNVVKKNKFGIKQDRVFGIDFHSIYNAKRSAHRDVKASERNNVRLAQRDIKDIIRFERVEDDTTNKTFRITWQEENVQYNIEYACSSDRDCTQIINKLTYIRNKRNHG